MYNPTGAHQAPQQSVVHFKTLPVPHKTQRRI